MPDKYHVNIDTLRLIRYDGIINRLPQHFQNNRMEEFHLKMSQWSFLSNHGAVLAVIAQNKAIKAADIAAQLELTERSVRRIIADLYNDGYIKKKYEGGVNHYEIIGDKPLRRKAQENIPVKALLKVLGLDLEEETK